MLRAWLPAMVLRHLGQTENWDVGFLSLTQASNMMKLCYAGPIIPEVPLRRLSFLWVSDFQQNLEMPLPLTLKAEEEAQLKLPGASV